VLRRFADGERRSPDLYVLKFSVLLAPAKNIYRQYSPEYVDKCPDCVAHMDDSTFTSIPACSHSINLDLNTSSSGR
jgi:hypothetical protein